MFTYRIDKKNHVAAFKDKYTNVYLRFKKHLQTGADLYKSSIYNIPSYVDPKHRLIMTADVIVASNGAISAYDTTTMQHKYVSRFIGMEIEEIDTDAVYHASVMIRKFLNKYVLK